MFVAFSVQNPRLSQRKGSKRWPYEAVWCPSAGLHGLLDVRVSCPLFELDVGLHVLVTDVA